MSSSEGFRTLRGMYAFAGRAPGADYPRIAAEPQQLSSDAELLHGGLDGMKEAGVHSCDGGELFKGQLADFALLADAGPNEGLDRDGQVLGA